MANRLRTHVSLIGFMGCGKSTVGPILARTLGVAFADTDTLVERMAQKTIADIFSDEGESAFRSLETKALTAALKQPAHVIATGGGIVGKARNRQLLFENTLSIWLHVPIERLLERLAHDTDRPLLQNDSQFKRTRALYNQRKPLYEQAHIKINADASPRCIVQGILEAIEQPGMQKRVNGVEAWTQQK